MREKSCNALDKVYTVFYTIKMLTHSIIISYYCTGQADKLIMPKGTDMSQNHTIMA